MLPGIDIDFSNGALGAVAPSPDKTYGVVANAVAVGSTFELDKAYVVTSLQDVAALGIIDSIDNHRLYKFLSEFYSEAETGTELWLMGFSKTELMSDLFSPAVTTGKAPVEKLLDEANGKLRGIFTVFSPEIPYTPTITNGLDSDVALTITKAQTLAENYTSVKFAPLFIIIEGYAFDGDHVALADLGSMSNNRVGVLLGDTESRTGSTASLGCAMGVLAGRLAGLQVHVNPGKVKLGSLNASDIFILDSDPKHYNVTAIHDKGYISFRNHTGKSGYFFTDSPLATSVSDDYHYLERRRVIDKAYRLAYTSLLDSVLDDFDVNSDGSISSIYAKTIQGQVESAIFTSMTSEGELSVDQTDKDDKGVIAEIDLTHNVTSTSKVKLTALQVKPKGYARYIEVPLGYIPVGN